MLQGGVLNDGIDYTEMKQFTVERTYMVTDTIVETVSVTAENKEEAIRKTIDSEFDDVIGVKTYDGDTYGDVTAEIVE
tara:strand:- start:803 stop:1036 length:234 start_codon:yes stop_codon:yes gene_type:complete